MSNIKKRLFQIVQILLVIICIVIVSSGSNRITGLLVFFVLMIMIYKDAFVEVFMHYKEKRTTKIESKVIKEIVTFFLVNIILFVLAIYLP